MILTRSRNFAAVFQSKFYFTTQLPKNKERKEEEEEEFKQVSTLRVFKRVLRTKV